MHHLDNNDIKFAKTHLPALDDEGYDAYGRDVGGFDRFGFDINGLDEDGLDDEGYDAKGLNRAGRDRLDRLRRTTEEKWDLAIKLGLIIMAASLIAHAWYIS
jgi:hypothetical protein